jgi:hypothetical protein
MEQFHRWSRDQHDQSIDAALSEYAGLRETLFGWCTSNGDDLGPLTSRDVAKLMARSREARNAVKAFLSSGGAGYERDAEVAEGKREALAWQAIEILTSGNRDLAQAGFTV